MEEKYFNKLYKQALKVLKVTFQITDIYHISPSQKKCYEESILVEDKLYIPLKKDLELLKRLYQISYNRAFNYQAKLLPEDLAIYRRIEHFLHILMIQNKLLKFNSKLSEDTFFPKDSFALFHNKALESAFLNETDLTDVEKKKIIIQIIKRVTYHIPEEYFYFKRNFTFIIERILRMFLNFNKNDSEEIIEFLNTTIHFQLYFSIQEYNLKGKFETISDNTSIEEISFMISERLMSLSSQYVTVIKDYRDITKIEDCKSEMKDLEMIQNYCHLYNNLISKNNIPLKERIVSI